MNKNVKKEWKYLNVRHHKYLIYIHHLDVLIYKSYDKMKNILKMRMNFIKNQTI